MSARLALLSLVTLFSCSPARSVEDTKFAASLKVDLAASTKLDSGLYFQDLTVGPGAEAVAGQKVTMRYTGWLADGTQFDSNQTSGFQFTLGAGEVIAGWDQGVPGMKVGGARKLIIPSALGYGESGVGPIPPNANLVFDVSMISTP